MLSWLVLILAAVYFYRGYLNSRMDRKKLSHSSYYEVAYGGEKKCVDQAAAILKDVGGYGRILRDWRYLSENGPSSADVILLHETGVYVLETKDYGGWISGNPQEEYWVQTLWTGRYTSCQNYFLQSFSEAFRMHRMHEKGTAGHEMASLLFHRGVRRRLRAGKRRAVRWRKEDHLSEAAFLYHVWNDPVFP